MKRAIPVFVLTVTGLIPVWRYHPSAAAPPATAEASEPSAPSGTAAVPSSSASSGSNVVPGSAVSTEKGVFQVEVTFRDDRIASVRMLRAPHHPQTRWAVPELIDETLKAQSAHIDTVSGATVTSEGYRKSLQSALDARGRGS